MPISSVTIDAIRPTADSVEVDWTAQGLIFTGTADISGFVEVVSGGFSPTVEASTPIDESQGRDTESYTYSVGVSDVPAGDYTARVVWNDGEGNSGRASQSVMIPEGGSDGGGEPGGGGGGLLITDLTLTCSLSTFDASPGDTITASYDIEGAAPPAESYDVDVDLYSNGTFINSQTEGISPNGAGGGSFGVELPAEGTYDINVELSNLRRV